MAKQETSAKSRQRLILSPLTKAITALLLALLIAQMVTTYHNNSYAARAESIAMVVALLVSELAAIVVHKHPLSEVWAGLQKKTADGPVS